MKQNITYSILETHVTFLFNYFTICPPLAAITLSSLPLKLFTTARNVSWGILAHSRSRNFFRASVLSWTVAQASLSKMIHTQKFKGFKSGNEGGHNSFFQLEGKWLSHQSCVLFTVWEGVLNITVLHPVPPAVPLRNRFHLHTCLRWPPYTRRESVTWPHPSSASLHLPRESPLRWPRRPKWNPTALIHGCTFLFN